MMVSINDDGGKSYPLTSVIVSLLGRKRVEKYLKSKGRDVEAEDLHIAESVASTVEPVMDILNEPGRTKYPVSLHLTDQDPDVQKAWFSFYTVLRDEGKKVLLDAVHVNLEVFGLNDNNIPGKNHIFWDNYHDQEVFDALGKKFASYQKKNKLSALPLYVAFKEKEGSNVRVYTEDQLNSYLKRRMTFI